jgi:hypothetical protein
MAMSKFSKSSAVLTPFVHEILSPIPFVSKVKKTDKVDGLDAEKSDCEFLMDPDNPSSKYSRQFVIFKDAFPDEWIKWVIVFHGIEKFMPMKELADKTRMFWTLLKGQALSYFEHHLKKRVEVEDSEFPESD